MKSEVKLVPDESAGNIRDRILYLIADIKKDLSALRCDKCPVGETLSFLDAAQEAAEKLYKKPASPAAKTPAPAPEISVSSIDGVKTCKKCGDPKSLDEFPKTKNTRDGRLGTCKKCTYNRAKKTADGRQGPGGVHFLRKNEIPAAAPGRPGSARGRKKQIKTARVDAFGPVKNTPAPADLNIPKPEPDPDGLYICPAKGCGKALISIDSYENHYVLRHLKK